VIIALCISTASLNQVATWAGERVVFARQYKMDRAAHSSAMPSATADERIPAHSSKPSAMAAA